MKTLLFLTIISLPPWLSAQQVWNSMPTLPFAYSGITDMLIDNDTLLVYGTGLNNSTDLKQGLILATIDTNGIIIQNNFLIDSMDDRLAVGNDWGKIIKTSDGGYAATAATVFRKSSFLIKLNHNLIVEFIKEYPDSVNLSNYDYNLKEVSGGYLLFGSIQLPNYNLAGFVKYVNYSGDIIWNKIFSNTAYGTRIEDLDQINDSLFVFVTTEFLEPITANSVGSARSGIYKINLQGNITYSWHSDPAPEIGYLSKVIALNDSEIITYGLARKNVIGTSERVQPTLTRFDSTNAVIWLKNFGRITGFVANNTLWDFAQTIDGNWVGSGGISAKTGNEPSRGHGWLYKFSTAGDSIWGRHFPTPFPDFYPNGGSLFGVGTLSSGSIMAAGTAQDGQNNYCWVVKITNDGCMDTLFCQASATFETPESAAITLYPNPAQTSFQIDSKELIEKVFVFDLLGRAVFEQTVHSLHTQIELPTGLSKGMYYVYIQTVRGNVLHKTVYINGRE